MGGGAMNIEIPMIQCKTSSPILQSPPPSSSGLNFPVSVNNTPPLQQSYSTVSCCNCSSQTESSAGGKENKFFDDIFGPHPSQIEVETAISALQNFLRRIWTSEPEFKPPLQTLGGYRNGRVEEAFRLLLTEPIIQRVVFSLSSDKAVWAAVMNNEMVRQLQESYVPKAQNHKLQGLNEESDLITWIINWLMHLTKAKVTQLIQKFELLMNQIFIQPEEMQNEESNNEIDDRVRSSFILSLVIFLIVVVARLHRA